MGKNYISNADVLADASNPLLLLQEVYLYMNELRSLPQIKLPSLRILNVNRNHDLAMLAFDYCPLLEQVQASYCGLTGIKLELCPSICSLDVSFNRLEKLSEFASLNRFSLRDLVFKDNKFNKTIDSEWLQEHLLRIYPRLEKIDFETVKKVPSNSS